MRQTIMQESTSNKRGSYTKRIASAILAGGMVLSMSVNAFASIGFNGGNKGASEHDFSSVHYANGKKVDREDGIKLEDSPFPNIPGYNGTIYVDIGETVTVHLHQMDVQLFGIEGFRKPYWYDDNNHDFQATVGISTNLDGLKEDQFIKNMKQYKAKNDPDYVTYCMELYLTGKKAGTEYFYFSESSVLELSYYKVVVGGGSGNTASTAKQQETTKESAPKATEQQSTGSTPKNTGSTTNAYHTVQAGDTLAKIALNAYGDMSYWPQIQAANKDALSQTKDGLIYVGMSLTLPANIGNGPIPAASAGAGEKLYTVKAGDTYGSIAQAHFGNANRYKEIFNRNSDRLKDINTLFEGQIIVLP